MKKFKNSNGQKKIYINPKNTDYASASILLDVSREECARERERTNILDNKANIFMSAIIAVVTIFIPIIPFSKLIEAFKSATKPNAVALTVTLCVFLLAVIFMVKAILNLYGAFKLKRFLSVDFKSLNNESNFQQPKTAVEKGLIEHYNTIIENNSNVNNEKAIKITAGLKYSMVSFSLLCISAISLIVLVGR